jgi:hypothetical protein
MAFVHLLSLSLVFYFGQNVIFLSEPPCETSISQGKFSVLQGERITTERSESAPSRRCARTGYFTLNNTATQCCGSGIQCLFDPGSGMGKNPDLGTASGMNNPDHFLEILETTFWVKILKFFDADPG